MDWLLKMGESSGLVIGSTIGATTESSTTSIFPSGSISAQTTGLTSGTSSVPLWVQGISLARSHMLKALLFDCQVAELQLVDMSESAQSGAKLTKSFFHIMVRRDSSVIRKPNKMGRLSNCRNSVEATMIPFDVILCWAIIFFAHIFFLTFSFFF